MAQISPPIGFRPSRRETFRSKSCSRTCSRMPCGTEAPSRPASTYPQSCKRMSGSARSKTTASDSRWLNRTGSSSRLNVCIGVPRVVAPVWDWRFANGLWSSMAAGSGRTPSPGKVLHSSSQFRRGRLMKTVLVIDDDAKFRETLTGLLRQFGYHALEAANGREAVDTLERLRTAIDLMIVDLALPEISGVDIIGAVTRRKTTITIIATSAVFDEAYLEMVKGVGADETIRKAAIRQPEKGLEVVRRLLGSTGDTASRPSPRAVRSLDAEHSTPRY